MMTNPDVVPNDLPFASTELIELIETLKVESEGFTNAYSQIDKACTSSDTSYSEQDKEKIKLLLMNTRKEIKRLFAYSYSNPQRNYIPSKEDIRKVIYGVSPNEEIKSAGLQPGDRDSFHLALEIFSAIRTMIVNEDALINHRISWQIAIQGGVALAFVHFYDAKSDNFFPEMIILGTGILFSFFCFIGVVAAFQAVQVFKDTLHNYQDILLPDTEAMPRVTGDRFVARRGAGVGKAYAILPGLLWFIIGLVMIYHRML